MHLLEQDYTILETLIAGSLFSCFHRYADCVDIACIAQSVNVISPIRTEKDGPAWRQSIYFPFELTSRYGRGISLKPEESGNEDNPLYGSAVLNEENAELTLFLTNRSAETLDFSMEFAGVRQIEEALSMSSTDLSVVNSAAAEPLQPRLLAAELDNTLVKAQLPALSWNMLRLKVC